MHITFVLLHFMYYDVLIILILIECVSLLIVSYIAIYRTLKDSKAKIHNFIVSNVTRDICKKIWCATYFRINIMSFHHNIANSLEN